MFDVHALSACELSVCSCYYICCHVKLGDIYTCRGVVVVVFSIIVSYVLTTPIGENGAIAHCYPISLAITKFSVLFME